MNSVHKTFHRRLKVNVDTIKLHNHTSPSHVGVAKAESEKFNEAINLFSRALQLDPSHDAARKHLEQAKMQLRTAKNISSVNSTR